MKKIMGAISELLANPITTNSLTFLTHNISGIGGVITTLTFLTHDISVCQMSSPNITRLFLYKLVNCILQLDLTYLLNK